MVHHAGRVPIHPDAFSRDLRGKHKRPRNKEFEHLKNMRKLPCVICGTRNAIQAAHIRAGNAIHAKRATGMGERPDDRWSLPLCAAHHEEQHKGNEMVFWQRYGIPDPCAIALDLHGHSGDEEACELVIKLARQGARK